METGYNKYNLFFINKKGAKYEEVITKCKSGGGHSQLTCGKKAVSQVLYSNVIAHLLRNLEYVIKRSRTMCAMTGLNILPSLLWESVSEGQESGLLQRRMSLFNDSKESRYDIESSCKTQVAGAAATLPKRTYSLINLFSYSLHKKAAFTLAEVLITLGIIGVVAAMTLPSLVANYKEKEVITKAKKDYSIITQAFRLAQAEEGVPGDNSILYTGAATSDDVAKAFSKYIPGGHLCLSNSKEKLCKDLNYNILYSVYDNQHERVTPPAIILPDNGVVFLTLSSQKCVDTLVELWLRDPDDGTPLYNDDGTPKIMTDIRNSCGNIMFDVNGARKPNKFGYDAFGLTVWSDRINKGNWNVYGADSLFSILTGGELKYNTNK